MISVFVQRDTVIVQSRQSHATLVEVLNPEEARIIASQLINCVYNASKYQPPEPRPSDAERIIALEKEIGLLRKKQEEIFGHPPPVVEPSGTASNVSYQDGFHSTER